MKAMHTPQKMKEGDSIRDPVRVLWYRLLTLSYWDSLQIVKDLGLIEDEDKGLRDEELYSRVFQRAIAKKKMAVLWDSVEGKYSDGKYSYNPFRK